MKRLWRDEPGEEDVSTCVEYQPKVAKKCRSLQAPLPLGDEGDDYEEVCALPPEIWHYILSFLKNRVLFGKTSLVCSSWRYTHSSDGKRR